MSIAASLLGVAEQHLARGEGRGLGRLSHNPPPQSPAAACAVLCAGPAGLGLQPNAMSALKLLSGADEGASLAHDVAAAGVHDPVVVITTHTGAAVLSIGRPAGCIVICCAHTTVCVSTTADIATA